MIEQRNAIIESTSLGVEDHGILTCMLHLDYGGSGQGFGGYAFDHWDADKKCRIGHGYGTEFIRRILDTLEVEKWESLRGTTIRVKQDSMKVYAIGHIIKDRWFNPDEIKDHK